MPDLPPPTLRLQLDETALAANWRALDRMSGSASAACAVKADAYGLGANKVVPVLRDAGARAFYVAHWSEVPAVIAHVPPEQVSVLHGPIRPEDTAFARAAGVRPVINSIHQAQLWAETGGGACDLMVDTGINRLGISRAEIGAPAIAALDIQTLLSHLACADEDSAMNAAQQARLIAAGGTIPHQRISLANSAGIALGSEYHFDQTRPGLSLYGGVPRPELADVIRQVAMPQAALIQVRHIEPGDSVGYNATFTADRAMRIGVVSLGYADGFLRCWGGHGVLRHGEARLPLLGRVSMDMVVIDLGEAPALREGDWVDVPWRLPEAAEACGLSQYELLTGLGRRFRR